MKNNSKTILLTLSIATSSLFANAEEMMSQSQARDFIGTMSSAAVVNLEPRITLDQESTLKDRILYWHGVALDSVAIDHTSNLNGNNSPSQGGPTRTTRALAMVQLSLLRSLTEAIDIEKSGVTISKDIAVMSGTARMLQLLYPNQAGRINKLVGEDQTLIVNSSRVQQESNRQGLIDGRDLGADEASSLFKERESDGSNKPEVNWGELGSVGSGDKDFQGNLINSGVTPAVGLGLSAANPAWTRDPNTVSSSESQLALGAHWGAVAPFSLNRADQFRIDPSYVLAAISGDPSWIDEVNAIREIGGVPETQTVGFISRSTPERRFIGNYWGYDGVPGLGVPPRLFNQIAAQIINENINKPLEVAKMLAKINVGLADGAIASWDSKYYYNFWRPVTAIKRTDEAWSPIGISVINTTEAIRPTPPFPAYPSGHSTFGSILFEMLRNKFGNSKPFTFVSDEYNGEGIDPLDAPRPLVPVRFDNFTDAENQNGLSRIYNGVHWRFDNTEGKKLGKNIATFIINNEPELN